MRRVSRLSVVLVVVLTAVLGLAGVARPQGGVTLVPFASGFAAPVDIESNSDGLLYVAEMGGRIKIVQPDGSVSGQLLDISGRVLAEGEQGLLSFAFAPDYATSGRFYAYYTRPDGNNQLSRFGPAVGAPGLAETPLLTIPHPEFFNHNGADLNFGPDGYLYVSVGDGGSGNDPHDNGQNRDSLLGKMLRLDVDGDAFPSDPARNYAIPPTNPFVGTTGADEIWAFGLRNPWRFSFDSVTGHMYIGDVGQNVREEVDFQRSTSTGGENYGWRCYEGTRPNFKCPKAPYVWPVAEYDHSGGRCSVTGGYVYRGSRYSAMYGDYFYMDFCNGELFSFDAATASGTPGPAHTVAIFPERRIVSFGEGTDGELYVADIVDGTIYRVQGVKGPKAP